MQKQNLDIIDKLDGEEGFVELVMKSGEKVFGEPLGIIWNEDEYGWDTIKRILFKPYFSIHTRDYGIEDIDSYIPIYKDDIPTYK